MCKIMHKGVEKKLQPVILNHLKGQTINKLHFFFSYVLCHLYFKFKNKVELKWFIILLVFSGLKRAF